MVGSHHQLNGHKFEQSPGDSEGQGSLERCSPWGLKESDMTQQLNNNSISSFIHAFSISIQKFSVSTFLINDFQSSGPPCQFSSSFHCILQNIVLKFQLFLQCFFILEYPPFRLAFCPSTNTSFSSPRLFLSFGFLKIILLYIEQGN